ncbi:carbohydrate ABC transporter permease [Halopelagius longus]|uniref:Carbohydrate ABC transporter membrane protein 2, CUT1 family n=1 Tax=Halopelagius longus TaxID=1236180 RepID=A0A1H0XN77_9EURY|nr:carbohydrate ABC transporter permease [Halopelagius longus]RDI71952.1 carbohydrate ABC transporter permease [Halopelagius longus]SDQ04388.1 carbohydrate ABC transporter membrane protein 2, CUT1 family [Halopelagius longus]
MAADTDDPTAQFRKNQSWLYDSEGGAYLRKTLVGAATLLVFLFVLFPLYWMAVTAFKTTAEIQRIPPTVFPEEFSLEGFRLVVESSLQAGGYAGLVEDLFGYTVSSAIDIDILGLIFNSLKVAIGAGLIALVLGSVAAYVLARHEFPGKNALMSLLLASLMFPGTAIMVPEWELINTLNLFNTHVALVLIYGAMTAPFVVWLMKGFFDDFPDSIIDAARMDQCSSYETFRYVLVPMARNSLIASFIFAFLLAWNELVFALTLLSNENYTVPPGLLTFVQGFNTQWNVVAAASILVSLPVLVGLAYIQRYFVQGLTGGAIKG